MSASAAAYASGSRTRCCDTSAAAQHRDGGAQLVGRVGHEAPHLLQRPLHRLGGLPGEEHPPARHQAKGRQRRDGEHHDEERVAVLQLHPIGEHHGHVPLAVVEAEPLCVDLARAAFTHLALGGVHLAPRSRLTRQRRELRRGRVGADETARPVEEVERAVRDVQLVHRVHHRAVGLATLHLAHPGGTDQLPRRAPEREVELAVELRGDGGEQADAEDQEDEREGARIPRGEPEAESPQRIHHTPNR
jgi:hypothetical protein